MKITKSKLKQIIEEEIGYTLPAHARRKARVDALKKAARRQKERKEQRARSSWEGLDPGVRYALTGVDAPGRDPRDIQSRASCPEDMVWDPDFEECVGETQTEEEEETFIEPIPGFGQLGGQWSSLSEDHTRITKSKLKQIIKEEIEAVFGQTSYKTLDEQGRRARRSAIQRARRGDYSGYDYISAYDDMSASASKSNMEYYISLYPSANNERIRMLRAISAKKTAQLVLKQVKRFYLNNFNSFRRLISGYVDEPEDVTRKNWKDMTDIIEKKLDSTPIIMVYDKKYINTLPREVLEKEAYYRDKKIYINPFKIYKNTTRLKAQLMMRYALREEYIHRAQDALQEMRVPTHHMVHRAAKKKNLFLPWEKTGLPKATYTYYAENPWEFHAKLLQIKLLLRKQEPESFDPGTGEIKPAALLKRMNKGSGEAFMVLRMLDPKKIDQISEFFDTVAKASPNDRGPTSLPA